MLYFCQQLLNGLTLGAVYALVAIGYTMVYGILGMINFAHGDIYMIGAFLGVLILGVLSALGLSAPWLVLPIMLVLACVFTAGYGGVIERLAYRPLRSAPRLAPLITAIGVSIFLQNAVQQLQGARVQTLQPLFASNLVLWQQAVDGQPDFTLAIGHSQLLIWGATLFCLTCLSWLINRSRVGRAQRAVAQDLKMAAILGVPTDRVIGMTFVLGSALAAVAGVLVMIHYGVVDFMIGFNASLKAFAAAVLGGIGSLSGAVVGGLIIGLVEALWAGYLPGEYKDVAAFALLIAVLLVRPSGLFGRPEVSKV
ncbi:MAG: branched-chain amino acid ABC transporter permease LivH [Alphaproteobacteria bacterium]|nr:branched-chain amino acid ABC transporter permease LivH [Alphaproteobacteria bacterium]